MERHFDSNGPEPTAHERSLRLDLVRLLLGKNEEVRTALLVRPDLERAGDGDQRVNFR
jgi:hypothetical protein